MAEVIEQAIFDRRRAVALRLIDERAVPVKPLTVLQQERVIHLDTFFYGGGLETALDAAGFDIPPEVIRRKSSEPNFK